MILLPQQYVSQNKIKKFCSKWNKLGFLREEKLKVKLTKLKEEMQKRLPISKGQKQML